MENNKKKWRRTAALGMLLLIVAAYVVSDQWLQLLLIQGESMRPSYHSLQPVLLDKRTCSSYQTGDVVAFWCRGLHATLVKRIAACPGDQVLIAGGTLYVNGEVSQIYREQGMFAYAGTAAIRRCLQEGEYFVLGDETALSRDSRYQEVGIVKEDTILGRVIGSSKRSGG